MRAIILATLVLVSLVSGDSLVHKLMKCLQCDGHDCNTGECYGYFCFIHLKPKQNGTEDEVTRGCVPDEDIKANPDFKPDRCEVKANGEKWCTCGLGELCNQGTIQEFEEWMKEEYKIHNGVVYYKLNGSHMTPNVSFSNKLLQMAANNALRYLKRFLEQRKKFFKVGIDTHPKFADPNFLLNLFATGTPSSVTVSYGAVMLEELAKSAAMAAMLNPNQCLQLQMFELRPVQLKTCPFPGIEYVKADCSANYKTSTYRRFDGRCNNEEWPLWGAAHTPFPRFIAPFYDNILDTPRTKSHVGWTLPNAREVSYTVHLDSTEEHESTDITAMFMQWGQFLDHDINLTPIIHGEDDSTVQCCPENLNAGQEALAEAVATRPECFPIHIAKDDPHYGPFNFTCMNFARSVPSPNVKCTLGYREQINEITSFIDGSMIYGSSEKVADSLRKKENGLMKMSSHGLEPPKDIENKQGCPLDAHFAHSRCIFAGDVRANEQASLRAMHTVFLRYHNKIATDLKQLNPNWDDEKIYQETRKIMGAFVQQITYGEWLPILFGSSMATFNLDLESKGYFTEYDCTIDAGIRNSFATAFFRFGHSMIRPDYKRLNSKYVPANVKIDLSDTFFSPGAFRDARCSDEYLVGLLNTTISKMDHRMTKEVTENLFKTSDLGMDLAALNIQRGRDHGIPPYNIFRRFCRGKYGPGDLWLKPAKNFSDLASTHEPEVIELLKKAYVSVEDIDPFTGAISEKSLPDALMGPTLQCILGKQFKHLRYGDRFWYETHKAYARFSREQLASLRKISFSAILCDSMLVDEIQPNPFKMNSVSGNNRKSCMEFPKFDLNPWKEGSVTEDLTVDDREHLITKGYRDSP